MSKQTEVPASFRDPSGFLFWRDGELYRQVNRIYREDYDLLVQSGLYQELVDSGLLISHREVDIPAARSETAYKIIQPEIVRFISYPYGWCFSQIKDAALLTLEIQKRALQHDQTLKDASAYNVQFKDGRPVFIDTLSFEKYREGEPWVAYRQFCQHFLAPLALMSYTDIRLNRLLRLYLDGIPLDLASRLMPWRTRFNLSLLSHVHLHSKSQTRYAERQVDTSHLKVSRLGLLGLIGNLENTVKHLRWQPKGTEWADYYTDTNYSAAGFEHKKQIIDQYLESLNPSLVWDLGANNGIFSRLASRRGALTIAFDSDFAAVEKNYLDCRKEAEKNILPLVIDLTNPSPSLGWQHQERMSLLERGPADTVMALALVHHLAISNNVPFHRLAEFFSTVGNSLIIEFVPKDDSQVQRLLVSRKDIFSEYDQDSFEKEFKSHFVIEKAEKITDSKRVLYLMRKF